MFFFFFFSAIETFFGDNRPVKAYGLNFLRSASFIIGNSSIFTLYTIPQTAYL